MTQDYGISREAKEDTTSSESFSKLWVFSQKSPSACLIHGNKDFTKRSTSVETTQWNGESRTTSTQSSVVRRSMIFRNSLIRAQNESSISHKAFKVANLGRPSSVKPATPALALTPLIELTRPLRMRSNSFEPCRSSEYPETSAAIRKSAVLEEGSQIDSYAIHGFWLH